MEKKVLDHCGVEINVGDKVAVKPSGSSWGAYKIGRVVKIIPETFGVDKVRVEYDEEKCYGDDSIYKISQYSRNRPTELTEPTARFEVKHSMSTIDVFNVTVLHPEMELSSGKKYYITKYEAELIKKTRDANGENIGM